MFPEITNNTLIPTVIEQSAVKGLSIFIHAC